MDIKIKGPSGQEGKLHERARSPKEDASGLRTPVANEQRIGPETVETPPARETDGIRDVPRAGAREKPGNTEYRLTPYGLYARKPTPEEIEQDRAYRQRRANVGYTRLVDLFDRKESS